ncbi:MAG: hypothetical protein LC623_00850 [Halobacteriales archaeon]|nr:hypothetical protein [Halobacteriales archaeon]
MRVIALLAVLLLSGCLADNSPPTSEPTTTGSASLSGTTSGNPTLPPGPSAKEVHWDACEGWETGWKYPPGHPPGAQHNPKWGDPETNLFATMLTFARDCQRVSWGPFERPVRMILETHDFQQVPLSCYTGDNAPDADVVVLKAMSSLWVNDTQLADYLKQTYPGMPVYYSAIQTHAQPQGTLMAHQWTWGLSEQNQSELTVFDDQVAHNTVTLTLERMFWYDETGAVSFLDFDMVRQTPLFTNRVSYGKQYPPMLWGYGETPDYVSTGDWNPTSTITGKIAVFRDHECKQPAS